MPPQPRPLQSLAARSAPCHAFGGRDEAAKLVDDHAGHCGADFSFTVLDLYRYETGIWRYFD